MLLAPTPVMAMCVTGPINAILRLWFVLAVQVSR
jgi:hypothetical protein